MLAWQLPRRAVRPSIVWSSSTNDVCIFCHSLRTPNDFRRTYARATAPKAPSTRDEIWRNKPRVATAKERQAWSNKHIAGSKFLPPPQLLEFCQKSGLLSANPETVLNLLEDMRELGTKLDGPIAKELCDKWGVSLKDMFYVARACLYSRNAPTVQKLGKVVLLTMSANEVPEATLHLLRLAVRQDEGLSRARRAYDSTELSFARRHLRKLVAEKHPHAMVFQAKRLAAEGRRKEAIEMLTDAVSSSAAELQEVEEDAESMHKQYSGIVLQDNEASKGESPWTFLAQLHRTEGNPKGAEEAFRAGAMIDDDPKAYEGLCGTVPRFSKQWQEWMTKAAASGSWTAMNWLGRFYSVPLDQIPEEANVREEARQLEESESKIEWWYYYLDDKELGALGEQPGTKIVGADFWRSYRDPRTDSKLHMVQLNPRTALAMEWYELAWRSQFIFSDKRDVTINLAIQELIENAGLQDSSRSEPKRSLSSTMRHHRQHFANKGTFIWELLMIDFSELKDGLRKLWAKTFGKKR